MILYGVKKPFYVKEYLFDEINVRIFEREFIVRTGIAFVKRVN